MPHPLDPSLVFVLSGETPVGMGFLISAERILTCAHVVCQALGWPLDSKQPAPGKTISLRFVFHEKQATFLAVVDDWIPYSDTKGDGDLAVLKLSSAIPSGASPVQRFALWTPQSLVESYGHPDQSEGEWACGKTVYSTRHLVQLARPDSTGAYIKPGYSGSPVWDREACAVIGMVARFKDEKTVQVGFMLPWASFSSQCQRGEPAQAPPLPDGGNSGQNLRYEDRLYVRRPDDEREISRILSSNSMLSLWGPPYVGKTWLLRHLMEVYRSTGGFLVFYIDCQRYLRHSLPDLLKSLAMQILGLIERQKLAILAAAEHAFDNIWNGKDRQDPVHKFQSFIEKILLATNATDGRGRTVILCLDHLERIPTDTLRALQGSVRAWYNDQPDKHLWIVLSGSILLDMDPSIYGPSPFDSKATTVSLKCFNERQVRQMLDLAGLTSSEEELAEIYEWSGGSAGLLRLLIEHRGAKTPSDWIRDDADAVVKPYLEDIIALPLSREPQTLKTLCRLVHNPAEKLSPGDRQRFELAGLVHVTKEGYLIRCKAYRNFIQKL